MSFFAFFHNGEETKGDDKKATSRRALRPGVTQQNVLSQHRFGDKSTDCMPFSFCSHMSVCVIHQSGERVSYDLPYAQVHEAQSVFLNQDGVSNDPETFSCLMQTYERACARTKAIQIGQQKRFFGLTSEQFGRQFQTWRSWVCLKLQ